MIEEDAVRIATQYARATNAIVTEIESVQYVDTSRLPKHLPQRGSFWAIVFAELSTDRVVNNGLILNVDDATGDVTSV